MLGRTDKLETLEKLYYANNLQIALLDGKTGVGKTTVLKEFLKRKRKYYFAVRDTIDAFNQQAFYEEGILQEFTENGKSANWQSILEDICKKATCEKFVLAIDNAQLLNTSFISLIDTLLSMLHKFSNDLRMLVIFSGDGIEFLQKILHEYQKIITYITLHPLTFHDTLTYLADLGNEDKVLLYGVTGGYPEYLQKIDPTENIKQNLFKLFYQENSALSYLGNEFLAKHFRQPRIYHAILYSVSKGALRMKEIATAINMEDNKVSKYVDALVKIGCLKRMVPINEAGVAKQCKNICYLFNDNMLFFWYLFVYPYISAIEAGLGNALLRTKIIPNLQKYTQKVFLDICYQHCLELKARDNFCIDFEHLGFIWPRKGTLKDFRLAAYGSQTVCYMQCCWDKTKIDLDTIVDLQQQYKENNKEKYFIVFSRKGFTDRVLANDLRKNNIRLISLHYFQ